MAMYETFIGLNRHGEQIIDRQEITRKELNWILNGYEFKGDSDFFTGNQYRVFSKLIASYPCYPSYPTLAKVCRLSVSGIKKIIAQLVKMKVISVIGGSKYIDQHKIDSNLYLINRVLIKEKFEEIYNLKRAKDPYVEHDSKSDCRLPHYAERRLLSNCHASYSVAPTVLNKSINTTTSDHPMTYQDQPTASYNASSSILGNEGGGKQRPTVSIKSEPIRTEPIKTEYVKTEPIKSRPIETELKRSTTFPDSSTPSNNKLQKEKQKKPTAPSVKIQDQNRWPTVVIPASLIPHGITPAIINQIDPESIPVEALQLSLDAFAFDVEYNQAIVRDKIKRPAAWFLAIIRRPGGYNPPENFRTLEQFKLEQEANKIREQCRKKREEKEREIAEENFNRYINSPIVQCKKVRSLKDVWFPISQEALKIVGINNLQYANARQY